MRHSLYGIGSSISRTCRPSIKALFERIDGRGQMGGGHMLAELIQFDELVEHLPVQLGDRRERGRLERLHRVAIVPSVWRSLSIVGDTKSILCNVFASLVEAGYLPS